MKNIRRLTQALFASLLLVASAGLAQDTLTSEDSLTEEEATNLATFDDLDYRVFTNEQWEDLHLSHADDVIVHWPDGRVTEGIDVHIEDLAALFVWAPDTRILEHPIRIAMDNWTSVVGVFEGTFTEPMPVGNGEFIEPTGQPFRLLMSTVGRWEDGEMAEEWLFWDNGLFMQQIGLAE